MNFKIFFLIISTQLLFAQENTLVFVNNAKAYSNKNFYEFSNERSFCDLTISPDSTFSFYSRPHLSCSTWHEIKGKWKKEKNMYIFSSEYQITENDTRFTFSKNYAKKYFLKFRTDKKSPLENRNIKIEFIYDFDAEIDDVLKIMSFNQDNSIEFPFEEIPNHDKLASIRIEYNLSSSEKRDGYITESKAVNVKVKDIPNIVEIEFVEQPKKEMVYRTTIGKLVGDKLEIVSSSKTKTSLPEYLTEIEFEKYYELRK